MSNTGDMADEERDELLRGLVSKVDGLAEDVAALRDETRGVAVDVARLSEQGKEYGERLDRIEREHGSALREHVEQLHAIRVVADGRQGAALPACGTGSGVGPQVGMSGTGHGRRSAIAGVLPAVAFLGMRL